MAKRIKTGSALRRTAAEVRSYRILMKLLPIIAAILILILMLIFIITLFYNKYGSFTVTITKNENYALSLSEHEDFDNSTSRLLCKAAKTITNISGSTLPEYIENVDGEHNGENYVAYTFYCKNVGTETVTYEYRCVLANYSKGVEKAMRVRLYVDGVPTDYAWTATDGSGAEPDTVEFYGSYVVCRNDITGFEPGEITKYTVVIWLEGDDPDCVDSAIGGEVKVDMVMTIKGIEDDLDISSEDTSIVSD